VATLLLTGLILSSIATSAISQELVSDAVEDGGSHPHRHLRSSSSSLPSLSEPTDDAATPALEQDQRELATLKHVGWGDYSGGKLQECQT